MRVDLLTRSEPIGGARTQRRDDVGELMGHEMAADDLVVEMPLLEHLMIEEVPERTVPDVVEQSRDAERLLDEGR